MFNSFNPSDMLLKISKQTLTVNSKVIVKTSHNILFYNNKFSQGKLKAMEKVLLILVDKRYIYITAINFFLQGKRMNRSAMIFKHIYIFVQFFTAQLIYNNPTHNKDILQKATHYHN